MDDDDTTLERKMSGRNDMWVDLSRENNAVGLRGKLRDESALRKDTIQKKRP
jgi:hypothetical protein